MASAGASGSAAQSKSKGSSTTTAPTFINPVTGVLANLFGLPVGLSDRTGGLVLGAPGSKNKAAGKISSIFGTGGRSGDNPFAFGSEFG